MIVLIGPNLTLHERQPDGTRSALLGGLRSGRSARRHAPKRFNCRVRGIGREDASSASGSGPTSAVLAWYGGRVGAGRSLGPGLTSESADAARAVLRDDLSAGPQVNGIRCRSDLPGLGRGRFTAPAPSGRVPSLHQRKEMALTIVETLITGGVDTHADVHGAGSGRRAARRRGVPRHPGRLRPAAELAERVRGRLPGPHRGHRQLRRRPSAPRRHRRHPGRRGRPLRPPGPAPARQIRPVN
jgi:hypothetical protein